MSELKYKFSRVMVIDDNPIDIYIAGKLMSKRNFSEKVFAFGSAKSALSFLEHHIDDPGNLPQVIFVDIYMPVMSGFDFLEAFDKFPAEVKKHCRIFVVSSSIDQCDIRRVNENANVEGFGTKTISAGFLDSIDATDVS